MDYCDFYSEENKPIQIYNGESIEAPLLKSFCGVKIPQVVTSNGNALTVKVTEMFQLAFAATYSVYDNRKFSSF